MDHLKFLRKGLSVLLLISFVFIFKDIDFVFGDSKFIPNEVNRVYLNLYYDYLFIFYFKYKYYIWILYPIFLFFWFFKSSLLVNFIILVFFNMIFKSNMLINYGYDSFINFGIFYVFVCSCFNVSNQNILKFFLFLNYLFNGLNKLSGGEWRNGEALWKTFNLNYSIIHKNDFVLNWLYSNSFIIVFLSYYIIFTQLFFFLSYIKKTTKFVYINIIIMHICIGYLLNLPFFSAVMILYIYSLNLNEND